MCMENLHIQNLPFSGKYIIDCSASSNLTEDEVDERIAQLTVKILT